MTLAGRLAVALLVVGGLAGLAHEYSTTSPAGDPNLELELVRAVQVELAAREVLLDRLELATAGLEARVAAVADRLAYCTGLDWPAICVP